MSAAPRVVTSLISDGVARSVVGRPSLAITARSSTPALIASATARPVASRSQAPGRSANPTSSPDRDA